MEKKCCKTRKIQNVKPENLVLGEIFAKKSGKIKKNVFLSSLKRLNKVYLPFITRNKSFEFNLLHDFNVFSLGSKKTPIALY